MCVGIAPPGRYLAVAHRVIVLKKGVLVQQGTPQAVYHQPKHEYVARLFGEYNLVDASLARLLGKSNLKGKFLRPEQLQLTKKKTGKWVVEHVAYFGSYYLVTVGYKERKVKVFSVREWELGEKVDFALGKGA